MATFARITQLVGEIIRRFADPFARSTQVVAEVIAAHEPKARPSQLVVEVLVRRGGARAWGQVIG